MHDSFMKIKYIKEQDNPLGHYKIYNNLLTKKKEFEAEELNMQAAVFSMQNEFAVRARESANNKKALLSVEDFATTTSKIGSR
jgi:hypothetical protein